MPSLPPSLSEISAKLGGWGEGRMGEGWHLESWQAVGSWVRPDWAVPALAAASPLCHLFRFAPHPLSLFLSLLHPQQKRKEENRVLIPPTPDLSDPLSSSPQLTTPYHHQASVLSSWLGHLLYSPSPSHQNGCNVFKKYIHIYFKRNLKEKLFSLGMSCPSKSGSSVPIFMAGRGREPCPQLVPMNPMPGRRGGWGGVGVGWGIGRALFSLRLWWFLFFSSSTSGADSNRSRASPPPVPRAPVPFSPCF